MKVVILAGGFGTRISEESHLRPKPMIEIGERPILWHIMKIYAAQGFTDFIVCAGYKQHKIKEYFDDYYLQHTDVTFDYRNGTKEVTVLSSQAEPWRVTVADTGLRTMTGGRIKRIKDYVRDEPFMLTYGDGVADIDLTKLIEAHDKTDSIVTLSGVYIAQSKGILDVSEDGSISNFREKKSIDDSVINGGYMICEPGIFDYISGDESVFEEDVLAVLADEGKLSCYRHPGFWKCMDTQREREQLQEMWRTDTAPWKIW